ncbi:response regulator, partial [Acinetobacter baumannii]
MDVVRALRMERDAVPVLMLTARSSELDRVLGLELGADDYLTKPFDDSELLSAIAGRLARFQHLKPEYAPTPTGLDSFLRDSQQAGGLAALTAERRPHAVPRKQLV